MGDAPEPITDEELARLDADRVAERLVALAADNRVLRSDLAAAEAEVERLRAALIEAAENLATWGAYADEYFQEKWNLEGDIARVYAAAALVPETES